MTTSPTSVRLPARLGGWATFVGAYLALGGMLNVVTGIAVIVGTLQILGAGLVVARRTGGAIIALVLASLGVLFNFTTIGADPVWSCILLTLDALVLWAVSVHGEEFVQ